MAASRRSTAFRGQYSRSQLVHGAASGSRASPYTRSMHFSCADWRVSDGEERRRHAIAAGSSLAPTSPPGPHRSLLPCSTLARSPRVQYQPRLFVPMQRLARRRYASPAASGPGLGQDLRVGDAGYERHRDDSGSTPAHELRARFQGFINLCEELYDPPTRGQCQRRVVAAHLRNVGNIGREGMRELWRTTMYYSRDNK
uniref:Uncharacterized protein n=1 Tax=Mycena chlorophos TaxID=658473 RepID=A0ABQ0M0Z8_MYCCL|nr:predicted protein [Mycena chlorophos]